MKYIDNFLNKITMYRLMLYGLFALSFIAIVLGFTGILSYTGLSLIYSFLILTITCYSTNQLLAKIFKVQTNVESESISALILLFVCFPVQTLADAGILVLVAVVAMASKYILVWKKKHIFNPVAISLVIVSMFGSGVGGWWVASNAMLVPVLILSLLVLRKVRRFSLFFAFLFAGIVSIFGFGILNNLSLADTFSMIFTSFPVFFLGGIMLTEPLTTPPTRKLQVIYGVIVGILFGAQFDFGFIHATPALALVIGNIFSYLVSPRARLMLTLVKKEQITPDVYDFVFKSDEKLKFKPGQYLEWTLGHKKPDDRGNRRYFTIASSPTEENIILGTKFYPKPSTFKQKLISLESGAGMIASQLSGEFTMPEDKNKKLVFIAGGIGTTPFRSMAKYMLDTNESRDIVHLYSNKSLTDTAYKNIFDSASEKVGWRNIYVVNELGTDSLAQNMRVGFITKEMIMSEVPDYKERMFYISGTHGMVTIFEKILNDLGVKDIKTDFFPGFV